MSASFTVTKEIEFDAGHRVPDHKSKCHNPHGHRYRVVAHVTGPLQDKGAANGMVLDFGDIKALLTRYVHDEFDHGFIVYNDDPLCDVLMSMSAGEWKIIDVPWVPTAENMASAIFNVLTAQMIEHQIAGVLVRIEVWETPTSCAYFPAL